MVGYTGSVMGEWSFTYDKDGNQVTEISGAGAWKHTNVYADGELLATYDPNGVHFAFGDWQGTKRAQASATGTLEVTCDNLPFNDGFACQGPGGSDATEHHYTGKEHDPYTGLDLFGARNFTNYSGRFLSPDPSVLDRADPTNPQTLNLYAYALNNPLRYTDPTGLEAACHWGGNDWDDTPGNGGAGQGDCEQQGGTWEEVPGPETTVTVNGDTGDSSITVETWQPNPGEMIPYVSAGCSAVPTQSTQGSLQQNIKNAEAMKPAMPWSMSYFYSNVKNGGPQDYKQNKQMADVADAGTAPFMVKSPFEDFGNFNYGATAAAQGIPLSVALRAAGYAGQKAQGASAASAAKTAMGPAPYGDDPADQIQIQNGYNFYTRKCF